MKRTLPIAFALCLILACGGRLPSATTAHKAIVKQFHKYGKKYKTSDFGKYPVEKVEIYEVREIRKNRAEVYATVLLTGGPTYPVRVTLQKKPSGWKSVAWENLGKP